MLYDYVRLVHAAQNFKIKDKFEFLEFDDIAQESITERAPVPEHIEIWAGIKISYEGKIPESYRILNFLIGDWVEVHKKELTKVIHEQLKGHFQTVYPNSDTSEVHGESETSIWEDQLDYMPRINEADNSIDIEIELVLDTEIMD